MCHALGVKESVQERREWRAGVEWREGDQKRGIVRENIAIIGYAHNCSVRAPGPLAIRGAAPLTKRSERAARGQERERASPTQDCGAR